MPSRSRRFFYALPLPKLELLLIIFLPMIALIMVVLGISMRILPHIPNFSSVTATALFGGIHINKRFALVVPLIILILSDYILLYINPFNNPMVNFSKVHPISAMFHSTTAYVYGGFLISGLIGILLKNREKFHFILGGASIASIQFYLVTNFGVWATTTLYSPGIDGLIQSYIMGLPFFTWTFLGDVFYTAVFFGIYELAIWIAKNRDGMIEIKS